MIYTKDDKGNYERIFKVEDLIEALKNEPLLRARFKALVEELGDEIGYTKEPE